MNVGYAMGYWDIKRCSHDTLSTEVRIVRHLRRTVEVCKILISSLLYLSLKMVLNKISHEFVYFVPFSVPVCREMLYLLMSLNPS